MKKSNTRTLFSKNRIVLTVKDERSDIPKIYSESGRLSGFLSSDDGRYTKNKKYVPKDVVKKLESPLGFYYYKKETIYEEKEAEKDPHVFLCEIIMETKRHLYKLSFPERQGNISISVDTRPWNIVSGYKSLEDHFITDLFNDLESIFAELYNDKASVYTYSRADYQNLRIRLEKSTIGLGEYRKNLYLKLFGNTKGPVFQTNAEKILAHGFDLKTSFRKDKE